MISDKNCMYLYAFLSAFYLALLAVDVSVGETLPLIVWDLVGAIFSLFIVYVMRKEITRKEANK